MVLQLNEPNRMIAGLGEKQAARLNRYGIDVPLIIGTTVLEAGRQIDHVYFVRSGLISLLVVLADGTIADAGYVNCEGAAGSLYDIDEPISFTRGIVGAQGRALRVPREFYEELKRDSAELRAAIEKCNNRITARSQQTAACNLIHRLEARLCRWLLQIAENSFDANVAVTQDHLAHVLGVNRSRLNEAFQVLYSQDAVCQTQRGGFRITNIDRISDLACDCHDAMRSTTEGRTRVT